MKDERKRIPLSCLSAGGENESSEISKKLEMKLSRYCKSP